MKAAASILCWALVAGSALALAQEQRAPEPAASPQTERFESVEALMQIARLRSTRKDAAGALEVLRRALEIAPNSEEVLAAYAQVSLAARAPVPAILALEPLTRMNPSHAQHHYLLGVARMQAGDVAGAVEALEQAGRLEPDRALTLVALGLALDNQKRFAEAKTALLRALEIEPDGPEALAALAEAEEGLGELAEAEAHARRALARSDAHAAANLVLGMVLLKQGRYAEARDALEKAAAADPSSAKAHYQLSLAYARLGDDGRAQKQLELYREALEEVEERLKQLRSRTGLTRGGMRP